MAKPRHDEPTSSKTTMAVLIAGGLLVAALVVWALTRTVEPDAPPPVPVADATTFSAPAAADPAGTAPGIPAASDTSLTLPPPTTPAQPQGNPAAVKRTAVEDLRPQLTRGDVTVIDVRTAADYARGHIPGAINIPFASIETQFDSIPKGKPIVTYCT
jgi:hypothetical protein